MTENGSGFRASASVVAGGVVAAGLACAKAVSVAYSLLDPVDTLWTSLLLGVDVLLCLAFAALAASLLLHRRAGFDRVRVPAVAVLVLQPMYFLVYAGSYITTFLRYPAPLAWFSIFEYYGVPLVLGLLVLALFVRRLLAPARPHGFLVPAVAIAFGYGLVLNVYTMAVSFSYWTTYAHGFKLVAQFAFIGFHALVLLPLLLLIASLARPVDDGEDAEEAPGAEEIP